ncbi:TRAP transporter large permease subunit [Actinomycetes bacterium KLBMP 9759]
MNAIWALVAFIAVIVVWNVGLKRNIGESMFVGFVATALFAGTGFPAALWEGLLSGLQNDVTYAAIAFVVVGDILTRAGVIQRIVDMLSSLVGRFRGGSIHAATIGSGLFGAVAHNGSATAATIGSITIPWMRRSGASGETSALVISGNAGVGAVFPFSGAFFLMLAAPTVVGVLTADDVIVAMFLAGIWMVLVRLAVGYVLVRRRGVGAMAESDLQPISRTFRVGWSSLIVLAAIAVPILATAGSTGAWVVAQVGEDAADTIPLLVWLPVAMLVPGLVVGRKLLPRTAAGWWEMFGRTSPKLAIVAATMISSFSASEVLSNLGLGEQLAPVVEQLHGVPGVVVAAVVGIVVIIIAGPLSTTATLAAVGAVAFAAMTAAGVPPVWAFAAAIVFAASESASPPGAAPLYVAAAIANINPVRIFQPVILYYLVPTFLLGVLMAVGIAWIPQ